MTWIFNKMFSVCDKKYEYFCRLSTHDCHSKLFCFCVDLPGMQEGGQRWVPAAVWRLRSRLPHVLPEAQNHPGSRRRLVLSNLCPEGDLETKKMSFLFYIQPYCLVSDMLHFFYFCLRWKTSCRARPKSAPGWRRGGMKRTAVRTRPQKDAAAAWQRGTRRPLFLHLRRLPVTLETEAAAAAAAVAAANAGA